MKPPKIPTRQCSPLGAPNPDSAAERGLRRQSRIPANRALTDALFRNTPLSRSFTLNREGI